MTISSKTESIDRAIEVVDCLEDAQAYILRARMALRSAILTVESDNTDNLDAIRLLHDSLGYPMQHANLELSKWEGFLAGRKAL